MTTTTLTTLLRVYKDNDPEAVILETIEGEKITRELKNIGVRFERWSANIDLPTGADQEMVITAYQNSVEQLMKEAGYEAYDVLRLEKGTLNTEPMRQKFLSEHTHSEDEVRFFVEGKGAFYIHVNERIHQVICVRGDLISLPTGMKHWFDMGADPEFTVIRLFTTKEGWVASFTGDRIADLFPKL